MTEPEFEAVTRELDQVAAKLRECKDSATRKELLSEMRKLIAKLNEIVLRLDSK